ncbi:MAG: hypothetical protein EOP07_03485 [Proteobacteria bacterium]|nr:MAG: hypothetical protein EOP07_03485 [Pseudomonadota bacterium]
MLRYVLLGAMLLMGCRTVSTSSEGKELGTIPNIMIDHDEESSDFIYGKSYETPPVPYSELLLTFEKGINKEWSDQCRVTVHAQGHWSAVGEIGYKVVSDDSKRDVAVREYSAGFDHRLQHYMWHTSRGAWPLMLRNLKTARERASAPDATEGSKANLAILEKSVEQYKASGWAPPRYFQDKDEDTAKTGAGEDFLYMHRKMIGRLTAYLKERNLSMIPAWKTLPKPDDKQFIVGPEGAKQLPDIKQDEYYYTTIRIWEEAYKIPVIDNPAIDKLAKLLLEGRKKTKTTAKTPSIEAAREEVKKLLAPTERYEFTGLKNMSLSAYGHLLEMTLHNDLHARYAFLNSAARPNVADPLDRTTWDQEWAEAFNGSNYDSLNDTFASHVNPWFYRIHGWVDDRIDDWLKANDHQSIGTKEECAKEAGNCYVWLSNETYTSNRGSDDPKILGDELPWEGPVVAEEKNASNTKQMSLHAHKAPTFTPDVIEATRGFRAPFESMNRRFVNPDLKR